MKNKKMLIIIIAVAVALVAALLLLIFLPKSCGTENSGEATIDEGTDLTVSVDENGVHQAKVNTKDGKIENNSYGTLLEYVPSDLKSIHLENTKGTLDITTETPENETTKYTIKGFEDFDLQGGVPAEIGSAASSLSFTRVISLDGGKSADFGLDKPRASVTAEYRDNTKALIYVGSDAPQAAGTYVRFGDSDTVYLVEAEAVAPFDKGINDLMSLIINSSGETDEDNRVSSITVGGANFPETIKLEAYDGEKVSASFRVTAPFEGYANEMESSLISGGIRGLYALSVDLINPTDKQLAEAGLDKPYAEVTAEYPDTTVSLIAAKPDGDNVQIMEKGGRLVYTVAADKVPWVNTSAEKLVNEYALYPKLTALSGMKVTSGGKTYEFKLSSKEITTTDDDGNETSSTVSTVYYGDKEIAIDKFYAFYNDAAMIELADAKQEKAGAPELTLEYTYASDGATDKVEFSEGSDGKYVASLNGKAVGHVRKSDITRAANSLKELGV